ncbi:hypothetical protein CYR55_05105 [Chimaeribacter californicus]|uniref:TauD/TfdA-like domain-containing protein n=1 Tax=Chimaeribacter californicus TaxID=2060067 RepID=A0A2N5EDQ0_9GAMM|nr:TauD/TfdA family dioxygenase [Chimaeribacter californicus]PLR40663.1 hypothetical protein CYR55_05105 [Chimaeribacter californicus]
MNHIDLAPGFVTAVTGFDITTAGDPEIAQLRDLLYRRKVVALKHQRISREAYQQFAARFGELEPFKLKNYHDPAYPHILVLNNRNSGGGVGARKLGNMWHSDSSYLPAPLPLTFLHAQRVPEAAGDTLFIDMQAALAALPDDLCAQIAGRTAQHDVRWTYKVKADDLGESLQEIVDRLHRTFPASTHPAIAHHPRTGAQSLYLNPGYTSQVNGYEGDRGRTLLTAITDWVLTTQPRFAYRWEANDMLLWDNRSVWHCATPLPPEADRLMYRIGVNDGPFFGSGITAAAEEQMA